MFIPRDEKTAPGFKIAKGALLFIVEIIQSFTIILNSSICHKENPSVLKMNIVVVWRSDSTRGKTLLQR